MKERLAELLAAFQFLTRLPLPPVPYSPELLGRAGKFFPLVGLFIGGAGVLLHRVLESALPASINALVILTFLVVVTGALHEDALADAADGFGGGRNRERILEIMRDSRIGSYGGIAIGLSLLWRYVLLAELPGRRFGGYFVAAHVLCRWTALPLSYALAPARADGSGARVAHGTTRAALAMGSVISIAIVIGCLRSAAWLPVCVTVAIVGLSARYFQRRLGGITGDCFGATNQMTEVAVYFCGCVF